MPGEQLDREVEQHAGPGTRAFDVARDHRQRRLDEAVGGVVAAHPEDCAKNQ